MADGSTESIGIDWERFARYFGPKEHGSNYSAMCEAALGQGDLRRECRRCHGLGFIILEQARLAEFAERIAAETRTEERRHHRHRLSRATQCKACRGAGYIPQRTKTAKRLDSMATTVLCWRCRGSVKRHGSKLWGTSCGETIPPTDASAEAGDVCPGCLGEAYVVPITARPSLRTADFLGANEEEMMVDLDEQAADGDATARVMEWIAARDHDAATAIRILASEHGERWAGHRWGRSFALWPLSDAGALLADESKAQSDEPERYARQLDLCRLEREAHALGGGPSPRRQALIHEADTQARRRERRAIVAIHRGMAAA